MKVWTDYPFRDADIPYKPAPVRKVRLVSYDGDKYCVIRWRDEIAEIKAGYIYSASGRHGDVPRLHHRMLARKKTP